MYGQKSVKKKIEELEDEAQTLPVVFGMLSAKIIEQIVILNFVDAAKYAIGALTVAMVFIYRHEAKERAAEVKEQIEEE